MRGRHLCKWKFTLSLLKLLIYFKCSGALEIQMVPGGLDSHLFLFTVDYDSYRTVEQRFLGVAGIICWELSCACFAFLMVFFCYKVKNSRLARVDIICIYLFFIWIKIAFSLLFLSFGLEMVVLAMLVMTKESGTVCQIRTSLVFVVVPALGVVTTVFSICSFCYCWI